MKKLLLSLGTVAAVVTPVVAVVACGDTKTDDANVVALRKASIAQLGTTYKLKGAKLKTATDKINGLKTVAEITKYLGTLKPETSKDQTTDKDQGASAPDAAKVETPKPVEHAFKGSATYANFVSEKVTFGTNQGLFDTLGDEKKLTTLEEALKAIEAFNKAKAKFSGTPIAGINHDIVIALEGKTLEAQLFFQQDNEGSATPITKVGDVDLKGSSFKLDVTEIGHRINDPGSFGIIIVDADATA